MSETLILSGKVAAESVYADLTGRIESIMGKGATPGLAAVLVGDNPASHVYVRSKTKRFLSMGLRSDTITFPADVPESQMLHTIQELNQDKKFHGILVQ